MFESSLEGRNWSDPKKFPSRQKKFPKGLEDFAPVFGKLTTPLCDVWNNLIGAQVFEKGKIYKPTWTQNLPWVGKIQMPSRNIFCIFTQPLWANGILIENGFFILRFPDLWEKISNRTGSFTVIAQNVQRIKFKFDWTYVILISKIADVRIYRFDYRYFTYILCSRIHQNVQSWLITCIVRYATEY